MAGSTPLVAVLVLWVCGVWTAVFAQEATYTLHYFASRGKAETIRLLLNDLQLDYREIRYMRPPAVGPGMMDWEEEKPEGIESGLFPFGQLPVLKHIHRPVLHKQGKDSGSVSMAQSGAIMNYIGRQHGLYGKDPFADMRIDEMIGGIADLKDKWRARFYGKDKTDEDIAAALPLWREEVSTWLTFIENLKKKHGGQWMVGDELTLADFYAFEALDGAMRYVRSLLAPCTPVVLFAVYSKVTGCPSDRCRCLV